MRFKPATKTCEKCGLVFDRSDKPRLEYATFMRLRFCSYECSNRAAENGPDDFQKYVEKREGCWEWTGPRTDKNYGIFFMRGKRFLAHRYSYELANGPISDGLHVLHECDNPPCVNSSHLHLGTHHDNMMEAKERGRFNNATGEMHGMAKLTAEQVMEIRSSTEPRRDLALRYGVRVGTIYKILSGASWSDSRERRLRAMVTA
ncbi:MAG: hypothetical protein JWR80_9521 [Bradyrhizobium sp.]|nr:hypothetical protein [Bradyrhizobium sp.]